MSDCIGWLARNGLNRYRPAILYSQYSFLIFGVMLWVDSVMGYGSLSQSTWGSVAYYIPAKLWALVIMGASAISIIGLKKPVKTWMVGIGAFLQCVQFSVISYSVIYTGGDVAVGILASVFFLPLHMWLFYEAVIRWKISPSNSLLRQ